MKTKVLALLMVMTFAVGVAPARAVLPNTPGYDSIVLQGSASGPTSLTDFRRISRRGIVGVNPYVIPKDKVLVITEFSVIDVTTQVVIFRLDGHPVLQVDLTNNRNFNMTTGVMIYPLSKLTIDMLGAQTPFIILRGYLMPTPVP